MKGFLSAVTAAGLLGTFVCTLLWLDATGREVDRIARDLRDTRANVLRYREAQQPYVSPGRVADLEREMHELRGLLREHGILSPRDFIPNPGVPVR